MTDVRLRMLDSPQAMEQVEDLQREVWPGSETDIVPAHMLLAIQHNGGLVIGAFAGEGRASVFGQPDPQPAESGAEGAGLEVGPEGEAQEGTGSRLVGFVFGFPGLYFTPDGPRPKHASHMLGVHPDYRNRGVGFLLKRAQWQMVRHQGVDRITWTFDPLLSLNAYLNIARLGAVCNTYRRDTYGNMRDGLNDGLPSDRLQVDWWVNTKRVEHRLSKRARGRLDLAHFLPAGARILNPTIPGQQGYPLPGPLPDLDAELLTDDGEEGKRILLVEIPPDFMKIKQADLDVALSWRLHIRTLLEELFHRGYLVTDFIYLAGGLARSFYVLIHGESTL